MITFARSIQAFDSSKVNFNFLAYKNSRLHEKDDTNLNEGLSLPIDNEIELLMVVLQGVPKNHETEIRQAFRHHSC